MGEVPNLLDKTSVTFLQVFFNLYLDYTVNPLNVKDIMNPDGLDYGLNSPSTEYVKKTITNTTKLIDLSFEKLHYTKALLVVDRLLQIYESCTPSEISVKLNEHLAEQVSIALQR